jgi:hypothetical protein
MSAAVLRINLWRRVVLYVVKTVSEEYIASIFPGFSHTDDVEDPPGGMKENHENPQSG